MLTANHITDLLEVYFMNQNYEIEKLRKIHKGIDMRVVDNNGIITIMEIRGETSSKEKTRRYGQPFNSTQIWNHVSVALMKIIVEMSKLENENNKFALAFPINHREYVERILTVIKKLDITVYLVSENEIITL